jgi:hypothetical protein
LNILDSLGSAAPLQGPPVCSRKGCGDAADWQLLWNNPRIHTPERRKIWLACSGHVQWLEDYLHVRGLWKETLPLPGRDSDG